MPLNLVLGPANSAKAAEVIGAYADAAHRGALLVVPTKPDALHYSRELAQDGATVGSVLTFTGLAGEIARRARYHGRRLSTLQRDRVLRRALAGAALDGLRAAARSPGFASALAQLIAELQRALIGPPRLQSAMRAWAAQDGRRRGYAEELCSIYAAYVRELDRAKRVDDQLYAWRALDALRAAPGRWGTDPVFFYGFDDLHPLERDAVETLARVVGVEVTVSLTFEGGRAALAARSGVVQELSQLAERVLRLSALDDHYASRSRVALHHLERGLFEPGGERIDPGAAVRLLEAGGERAEAELVASEVLALLRSGMPAEEIVVIYRSLPRATPVLARVFADYSITAAIDRRVSFAHTALGRSLLALARCALSQEREARAQDLLDYLRYPGMLSDPDRLDGLEAQIRREALRTVSEARARLGWRLAEIDALAAASDAGGEVARHGRRLLAAGRRGRGAVLAAEEELDARALATMLTALGELQDFDETLSLAEVIELLEQLEVPVSEPARAGAVLASDPLAIRARRFRAVFVCGLQEGEFPTWPPPEPFLSDEQRRELASCAGLRLAPSEDALARERYLFYACISRATEQVILSYRSSDEEGNLALPSPFLADVSELLVEGWADRRRRRLLDDVVWPAAQAPTSRELSRSQAATAAIVPDPAAGSRSLSQKALQHVRHRRIVSSGALEAYADCPVKWLVERELQPAAVEPEHDAIVRGNLMHTALEQVLSRLGCALTSQSLPEALGIAEEVMSDLPPALAPGRPPAIRAAAAESIRADLGRYLRHEARDGCAWQPRELEARFGFEADGMQSLPALSLGDGSEAIAVRGSIDRVDVEPSGRRAIVRDYKSGSRRSEYQGARWRSDRQLQVPLYMLAVRDLLGLEPVAGLYQPLGGSDLRARGAYLEGAPVGGSVLGNDARSAEQLDQELDAAARDALALAGRIRAGELAPCPQTCSPGGCRYPGICRAT